MPKPETSKEVSGEQAVSKEIVKSDSAEKVEKSADSGKIHVIAIRAGYYKRERKPEGSKFTIDGEHQLGSWMKKI